MIFNRKCFVLYFLVLLSSCAYGPKDNRSTILDSLNGENYGVSPDSKGAMAEGMTTGKQLSFPVVKRKERFVQLMGTIEYGAGLTHVPLRYQRLILKEKEKNTILFQTTTNEKGQFVFNEPLTNGEYVVELVSNKYQGAKSIRINSLNPPAILLKAVDKKN